MVSEKLKPVPPSSSALFPFPQGSDDESYVSDVSDNISEDNASVTDNVSRQSKLYPCLVCLFFSPLCLLSLTQSTHVH